jgi:FkbM family methyltransferase
MLIPFDTLFPKYNLTFKGVLHIGANVGEERFMYDKLGIKKQIWIEGNPEIFLKLKKNISHNPHATALNYIIGDENKETILHISNNGSQSSSVLDLGTHKIQHPDVEYINHIIGTMVRIESLDLDLTDVDLLNIDLQGFEYQALRGMEGLLKQFKACYLEVNKADVYKGCKQIDSMDLFMVSHRFRRVETKWVGNWGDALYIR